VGEALWKGLRQGSRGGCFLNYPERVSLEGWAAKEKRKLRWGGEKKNMSGMTARKSERKVIPNFGLQKKKWQRGFGRSETMYNQLRGEERQAM